MCNLYTVKPSAEEVARYFGVAAPSQPFNIAEDINPGTPGLVVAETSGERSLRAMAWGFPLPQKSKKTGLPIKPKPVNNIADLGSYMWRFIAPEPRHRCLIVLSAFCEPEGETGAKTRTWFSVRDRPLIAWAGLWKVSDEWGPVYSGLMTDANEVVGPVHDRMPVILQPAEWDLWMHGSLGDVEAFQARRFPAELVDVDRTAEPWRKVTA